jgi:hypothetical protein
MHPELFVNMIRDNPDFIRRIVTPLQNRREGNSAHVTSSVSSRLGRKAVRMCSTDKACIERYNNRYNSLNDAESDQGTLQVDRAMKRWPKYGHVPAFALLIVLTLGLVVAVVRADTGTIQVTGNPATIPNLYIDNYPTQVHNVTRISVDDPNKQYTVVLNATDPDLLTDVRKIEVQLYTDHYNDTGDIKHHYSFLWNYSGTPSHFANVGPDGDYFDVDHSVEPTLTNPKGVFNFVFKLNKLAIYTNAGEHHWTLNATIFDNGPNVSWTSNTFDVNLCQSLSVDSSVQWTSLNQGSTWNPAYAPNPGTWTYTSNAKAKIRINATTPTNAYGNTFAVGNVKVSLDENHGTWKNFTLATSDWLTVNDEAQVNQPVYWFVDIPAGQPTGTYTFTYYITIAYDTYAD